MHSATTRNC